MSQTVYERRHTCRACCSDDLRSVLDLGNQPLANAFLTADQLKQPEMRLPLHLVRCGQCGLGQLTHVVDPEVLYGPKYPYRSGYSEGWVLHCHDLAEEIGPGQRVLEIGCLDGVMLRHCRDNGCEVMGVDPSTPRDVEFPVDRHLFTAVTRLGTFDIITAQNVFGHVDDARGFLEGVKANLAPEGTAIIECPWVVDLVQRGEWDTIYHEHLSYWGLQSLARVARRAGLSVKKVKRFPHLHGGTMRYYLGHADVVQMFASSLCEVWLAEDGLDDKAWADFEHNAQCDISTWSYFLSEQTSKKVAAYGASAKGNTLLNALTQRPHISVIYDDNPAKQGLYTPGWHIPVYTPDPGLASVQELIILTPNWGAEIADKARSLGFTGHTWTAWRQSH